MDLFAFGSLLAPLAMYWVLGALIAPFALYVLARWRAHREPAIDPQLGLRVALGYFSVVGLQVVLAGASVLLWGVLTSAAADDKGEIYRTGFALVVSGGGVLAAHIWLLRRMHGTQFPSTMRLVHGYNLVITGTLGLISLVIATIALFQKGSAGEVGRVGGAMAIVYSMAWVAAARRFIGEPTIFPTPSDSPSSSGPADTGPKLPPLGGGKFPPIS